MKNTPCPFATNCRKLVQTYLSLHSWESALFYADKAAVLTKDPFDIYWLAQCMFLSGEYHRASHLLQQNNLHKNHVLGNYLTVKCLLEAGELNDAMHAMNLVDLDVANFQNDWLVFDERLQKNQIFAGVFLLRGKVLEAMDNRMKAAECYKQALQFDVYSYEAFDSLIKHQMLSASEERDLLSSLPFAKQCTKEESDLLRQLYESKLKKYQTPCQGKSPPPSVKLTFITPEGGGGVSSLPGTPGIVPPTMISTPNLPLMRLPGNELSANKRKNSGGGDVDLATNDSQVARLRNSLDFHVAEAERLYYNCEYQACLDLCEVVLREDPYHGGCLPVYVSCLVALRQSNGLFTLAHKMVDLYPDMPIAWYAVGCYYYVIGKNDCARRYLGKATCVDRLFGPAWLAYGHSFAIENEHDQAMAAYFKASQLMRGCHLPLLYIGLECGLTNNVKLAEKFFEQALAIAPDDPFVMHEMGVVAFQNTHYKAAEKLFRDALTRVKKIFARVMPQSWEPLLNNLGHTCRKLKKYEEALQFHNEALLLVPQSAATYSNIGFNHALLGRTEDAVEWFHKALALKNDDSFCTTMLNYVVEQLIDEKPAHSDARDSLPPFDLHKSVLSDTGNEDSQDVVTSNDVSDMSMSIEVDMMDASNAKI